MPENVVNAYTVSPMDIQPGDVMMYVVKAMVVRRTESGKLVYRLYRCLYDGPVVQGSRVGGNEMIMCSELFPSLDAVAIPDR